MLAAEKVEKLDVIFLWFGKVCFSILYKVQVDLHLFKLLTKHNQKSNKVFISSSVKKKS